MEYTNEHTINGINLDVQFYHQESNVCIEPYFETPEPAVLEIIDIFICNTTVTIPELVYDHIMENYQDLILDKEWIG